MSLTICPQIHLPLLWRICTFMCASMLKDSLSLCVCVSVYTWRFPCLYVDFVIYREQSLETFTFIAGWRISVLRCKDRHTDTHTHTHTHTHSLWGAIQIGPGSHHLKKVKRKEGTHGKANAIFIRFHLIIIQITFIISLNIYDQTSEGTTDTVWFILISNLKSFKMSFAYW